MSLIFVRPTLPDGKLPTTSWSYDGVGDYASWDDWATEDIVDADVLQRNWAILYSHINGNLNGSDMNVDTASAASETAVISSWSEMSDWPIQDHRHSHNGVDSSLLADDVITNTLLLVDAAFCMVRSPCKSRNAVLIHGSALSETEGESYVSSGKIEVSFAWGYNHIEWSNSETDVYRDDATNGYCSAIVSAYFPNWNTFSKAQKRSLCVPYFDYLTSSNAYTSVGAGIHRNVLTGLDTEKDVPSNVIFQWLGEYLV
jgi:hypothetical protein